MIMSIIFTFYKRLFQCGLPVNLNHFSVRIPNLLTYSHFITLSLITVSMMSDKL